MKNSVYTVYVYKIVYMFIGVYTGPDRSPTTYSADSEIQDGAGFANSVMQDEADFAHLGIQDVADLSDSEMQYGSGFSRAKSITLNSQRERLTSYQNALHCDQPEKDLRCTRNEYSPKTKVINILRCLHQLTDRQKKRIKDLLCRFEQTSDVDCTSNCELICRNKCYRNSNIYMKLFATQFIKFVATTNPPLMIILEIMKTIVLC